MTGSTVWYTVHCLTVCLSDVCPRTHAVPQYEGRWGTLTRARLNLCAI